MEQKALVRLVNDTALHCGKVALGYYDKPLRTAVKMDGTQVSNADREIGRIINSRLVGIMPDSIVVGEEAVEAIPPDKRHEHLMQVFTKEYIWAVDPIDGTLNFISRFGDWGVSIGLLKKTAAGHIPFLGAVYLPLRDVLYYTDGEKSFTIHRASSHQPTTQELHPMAYAGSDDVKKRIFAINESKLSKYTFSGINNIRVPGSTVVQLIATMTGGSIGTVTSGHIWDIAASLAIGTVLGMELYDVQAGQSVTALNPEHFIIGDVRHDWKLAKDYFVSCESAKEFLMGAVSKKPI